MAILTIIPLSLIDNYIIAKTDYLWGIKSDSKFIDKLIPDNDILFIAGLNQGENKMKGFPFLKSYNNQDIRVEDLWRCKIKTKPVEVKDSPFGEDYPIVFELEIIEEIPDFAIDDLKPELVEIIRKLYISNNRFAEIDDKLFENSFNK
jgi:hypothetical protein